MDVLHDASYRQLVKLASVYRMPKYVTDHSPMEKIAADELDDALFADVAHRRFPIDSAGSTWLSAAYFNENRELVDSDIRPYVESNIKLAAGIYNIDKDVKGVLEHRAVEINPENEPSNYGFTAPTGERFYPMFDTEGIKRASAHFDLHRAEMPAQIRRQIACAIVKKAAENETPIDMSVYREAGIGIPNKIDMLDNILHRAQITKDASYQMVIANLARAVGSASAEELTPDILEKLADTLSEIDAAEGLDKEYGRTVLAPADFIYSLTVKEAADFMKDALTLDRHTFSIRKLAEMDPSVFKSALDDVIFGAITDKAGKLDPVKMAEVLPTLPVPDKMVLERHIAACCE